MGWTNIKYGDFDFRGTGLPIPSVSFNTQYDQTPAGALLGAKTNVTLNGQIIGTSGELNDNDNWDDVANSNPLKYAWVQIINYVSGMQNAFSLDYQRFTIECNDQNILGLSEIENKNTKIRSIRFSNQTDNQMIQIIDYSIDLEIERTGISDYFVFTNDPEHYVTDIENSYSIEPILDVDFYSSDPTSIGSIPELFKSGLYPFATGDMYPGYTITRRLGATGKATDSGALYNAKKFVTGIIAHDTHFEDALNNLTVFDRSTTIEASEIDGKYNIVDTFKAYSGSVVKSYTETFDINSTIDEKLNKTVTIKGTIKGLKTLGTTNNLSLYEELLKPTENGKNEKYFFPTENSDNNAYENASGYFTSMLAQNMPYNRALAVSVPTGLYGSYVSGIATNTNVLLFDSWNGSGWLNPIPLSSKSEHNIQNGEITYDYSFDSRPLSLVSGALFEDISFSDSHSVREKANQTVYYRMPLIQDLGTYTIPQRSVSYKATFPAPIYGSLPAEVYSQITGLIDNFNPNKLNPFSISPIDIGKKYIHSWISNNSENYDPIQGSFTKNITWSYELRYWI